jgi:hypothetical protein
VCETTEPPLQQASAGHLIRCHIPVEQLVELQRSARSDD